MAKQRTHNAQSLGSSPRRPTIYLEVEKLLIDSGVALMIFRHNKRIGLRELAKILGISISTLSRIERGRNCLAADFLTYVQWMIQEKEKGA